MQLNVHDVCRLMKVSERTVRHWIDEEELPAHCVGGLYHFNRSELFEWATLHRLPVPTELLDAPPAPQGTDRTLADAISAGGILYDLPGENVENALRSVVERMPLPESLDRAMLLQMFLARENLGSTAVGDGIAIPHPRFPVVLSVSGPQVTVCFLNHAIEFKARDGRPVDTLFVMVSPTTRWHSMLITQVAKALSDGRFRGLVMSRAGADQILAASRAFQFASPGGASRAEGTF